MKIGPKLKNQYRSFLSKLSLYFDGDDEAKSLLKIISQKLETLEEETEELTSEVFELPGNFPKKEHQVAIFTDGACRGNPGPGSWAFVIQGPDGKVLLEEKGVEILTTNNKMELLSVLMSLKSIHDYVKGQNKFIEVFLYSDSKYLVDGMTSWVPSWKSRGWKKADKSTPENIELWKELDEIRFEFQNISFNWVKGHAGHPQNSYCDKLANRALDDAGF